jgi:hypothetical protein
MNVLIVNNTTNKIEWEYNNETTEFFNSKLVTSTSTYTVTSLDDTIVYLILPLNYTVIKYEI